MSETSLTRLLAEIRGCRVCIENPIKSPLPHEPRPVLQVSSSARLGVFGQAPGNLVHQTGRPFTDPSGDRLRDWMAVTSEEFYDASRIAIIPMGFCFPGYDDKGGDLPPRKECAFHWRTQLMTALPNLETVILVGAYAQKWHLGKSAGKSLTDTVRNWRDFAPKYIPTPHPSWRNTGWLKKNPWFEDSVLPFLQQCVRGLIS